MSETPAPEAATDPSAPAPAAAVATPEAPPVPGAAGGLESELSQALKEQEVSIQEAGTTDAYQNRISS